MQCLELGRANGYWLWHNFIVCYKREEVSIGYLEGSNHNINSLHFWLDQLRRCSYVEMVYYPTVSEVLMKLESNFFTKPWMPFFLLEQPWYSISKGLCMWQGGHCWEKFHWPVLSRELVLGIDCMIPIAWNLCGPELEAGTSSRECKSKHEFNHAILGYYGCKVTMKNWWI